MEDVLDPEEFDENRDGPFYGNIGRCLHFMGQVDQALVCYQKSALLIQRSSRGERIVNQGYIRRWVGELLVARNEVDLGAIFLEAARLKWEEVSPPKAQQIIALQKQIENRVSYSPPMSKQAVERKFLDWISGQNIST